MRALRPFAWLLLCLSASLLSAAEPVYHLLAKGETLYAVAKAYGVSAQLLESVNGISDPGKLKVGQRLLIPAVHRVEKGETLFGIAKAAGMAVTELRALNKLGETAVIRPGDILYLTTDLVSSTAQVQPVSSNAASQAPPGAVANAGPPNAVPAPSPAPFPSTVAKTVPASLAEQVPAKAAARPVTSKASLPCKGEARYLDGKVFGIAIATAEGTPALAVSGGSVVSAGPYRGFGSVAFVQSRNGLIFVYGGNTSLEVRVGDSVKSGQVIGRIGADPLEGKTEAYFFVFKGGEPMDPTLAPRD